MPSYTAKSEPAVIGGKTRPPEFRRKIAGLVRSVFSAHNRESISFTAIGGLSPGNHLGAAPYKTGSRQSTGNFREDFMFRIALQRWAFVAFAFTLSIPGFASN